MSLTDAEIQKGFENIGKSMGLTGTAFYSLGCWVFKDSKYSVLYEWLTDDADSVRMSTKLSIDVVHSNADDAAGSLTVQATNQDGQQFVELEGTDPYEARRLAVFLAAAAMEGRELGYK